MSLRRALRAAPLAVSVAVLTHVLVFGRGHAPGAGYAPELLGTLAIALGLGLVSAFVGGWKSGRPSIATERPSRYAPLVLGLAGAATFGAIEWSEGHWAVSTFLQAAFAALPIAYLVLHAADAIATATARAGSSTARAFATIPARLPSARFTRRDRFRTARGGRSARGILRGRAPPVLI